MLIAIRWRSTQQKEHGQRNGDTKMNESDTQESSTEDSFGTSRRGFVKASSVLAGLAVGSGSGSAQRGQGVESGSDSGGPRAEFADTVLVNGKILTADCDDPNDMTVASAVAIKDGKVLEVQSGESQRVNRLIGPDTREVDLKGRTVIPGVHYNDADNAVPGGDIDKFSHWDGQFKTDLDDLLEEEVEDLTQVTTGDIMNHIVSIANGRDAGEFTIITAEELGPAGIPLNDMTEEHLNVLSDLDIDLDPESIEEPSDLLDAESDPDPDYPLAILVASGNASVVNSIMLDRVLEETPLTPEDNLQIITDEDGEPTGQLGQQATGVIGAVLRPMPVDYIEGEAVPEAKGTLKGNAAAGITGANGHMSGLTVTIMNILFRQNEVASRVFPWLQFMKRNPFWKSMLALNGNFQQFERSDERGPMIRFPGASVGPHSGAPDDLIGALTIEEIDNPMPQAVSKTGANKWTAEVFTGKTFDDLTEDERRQTDYHNFLEGRRHGWTFGGMHNMGSKAIDLIIDTVADAEAQDDLLVSEKFGTYGLDHNVDWLPEIVERAANQADEMDMRFGVALNEALAARDNEFLGIDNVVRHQYGEEGVERWAPLKTLLEAGVPFHIEGSDPEEFPEAWPMWQIQKAVTRVDAQGTTVAPEEALTRKEALTALTRWGARFMGMQDEFGSIEAGMWADLVVLNDDFTEVPADQIQEVRPVATLVGGEPTYVEDSFGQETDLESQLPDVGPVFD